MTVETSLEVSQEYFLKMCVRWGDEEMKQGAEMLDQDQDGCRHPVLLEQFQRLLTRKDGMHPIVRFASSSKQLFVDAVLLMRLYMPHAISSHFICQVTFQ